MGDLENTMFRRLFGINVYLLNFFLRGCGFVHWNHAEGYGRKDGKRDGDDRDDFGNLGVLLCAFDIAAFELASGNGGEDDRGDGQRIAAENQRQNRPDKS